MSPAPTSQVPGPEHTLTTHSLAPSFSLALSFFLFFFWLFRATPVVCGNSQARGQLRATATATRDPSLSAMLDP